MTEYSDDTDDWLPTAIYLIDSSHELVDAWTNAFANVNEVVSLAGDYFQQNADAIVSPANSFGIMDGGLDLAIREQLGYSIQGAIQKVIIDKYHGELPVGCAEIVETGDKRWKYMIAAPTMRIPERITHTINAYLAFRATLLAIKRFNQTFGHRVIESVVCSGLGTGIGAMPASRCAGQMLLAYKAMTLSGAIGRPTSIHNFHNELRRI